jgi:hypothetical protein
MTAYVPGSTETDLKKIEPALQHLAAARSSGGRDAYNGIGHDDSDECELRLTPASVNAAIEVGNVAMYVSAVTNGWFTITHAKFGDADADVSLCDLGVSYT